MFLYADPLTLFVELVVRILAAKVCILGHRGSVVVTEYSLLVFIVVFTTAFVSISLRIAARLPVGLLILVLLLCMLLMLLRLWLVLLVTVIHLLIVTVVSLRHRKLFLGFSFLSLILLLHYLIILLKR